MTDSADAPTPPLAIVGLGCLFPGSVGPASFWTRIVNKFDSIREVPPTHWKPDDYLDPDPKSPDHVYSARGGFLDPVAFEPGAFGIPPSNLEATDASQLLGLVVAQQAFEDCGYVNRRDSARVSVILGVTGTLQLVIPLGARLGHPLWKRALAEAGVDDQTAKDVIDRISDGYVGWQENSFPGLLGNVVAGRIANRFDLNGTNCVVDAACASSLSAVHLAAMELATGRADLVLTGGADAFNDVFMFTCFSKTPALSPTGDAKPFDSSGDGTTLGEGIGMVVLKRLDDARRDGDKIYAIVRGVGSSSDGKGGAIYAPRREGQIAALKNAYRVSGVSPETIELVEAHGTGTRVGDATEVSALAEVYQASGRKGAWCALGSIKSQIGHTKAAAGAAGLIKAALALHHKVLPPTIKVTQPLDVLRQPDCPLYVNAEKRPWLPSPDHPRRAAVSAFGFGGSNFHLVLEEASPQKTAIDWTGDVQIVAFSGETMADVRRKASAFPASSPWPELCQAADHSRREFSPTAPCRLLAVVRRDQPEDLASLPQKLTEAIDRETSSAGAGVFLGQGPAPGKLAVLFPGQGAQYVGMLRDLSCHFPPAFGVLARCGDVGEIVYPKAAFTAQERSRQEEALRATDVAQPAIGAVSLGAWRVLQSFGLSGDVFAGHSYGELVALCAAGRLSEDEFFSLSRLRGQLMADAGRAVADPGAMLAVKADEETITKVLADERIDLILANRNAPSQTVLSGPSDEIDRAAQVFARRKTSAVKLVTAAAFHSPLVAAARGPFREALVSCPMPEGGIVFANSTAAPYPAEADAARDLLAGQLARPVEWVAQVQAMHDADVRTFVEVGPGMRLCGLIASILPGSDAIKTAIDSSSGKNGGFHDLALCLAVLAARGHAIDLTAWDPAPPSRQQKKPAHVVELTGANYVKPRAARPPRPRITESIPVINGRHATMNQPRDSAPSTPAPTDAGALGRALEVTRESLAALQRMQEQTAQLHRQFLDGQEQAHRSVHLLLEQQQRLLQASLGQPVAPLAPRDVPAPAVVAPAAAVPVVKPAPILPQPPLSHRVQASGGRKPPEGVALAEALPTQGVHTPSPEAKTPGANAPGSPLAGVQKTLLEVIAEKTGYPAEMLEMGMSLDADLGIDSIKRVEILSALQERLPDAPVVKPEHLGTLHTLGDVASFLADSSPASGERKPPEIATQAEASSTPGANAPGSPLADVQGVLLEVIAEKTGYPAEMLEMGMSLDADLGIDSIKRVEILSALQERLPDAPIVKPEHLGTLHTLGDVASFLADSSPANKEQQPSAFVTRAIASEVPPSPPVSPVVGVERSVVSLTPLSDAPRAAVSLPRGAIVRVAGEGELADALVSFLTAHDFRASRSSLRQVRAEPPADLAALIILAPENGADDAFLRDALFAVQKCGPALKRGGALLTVSRLGGTFGFSSHHFPHEPIDGGLAGLAKTVRQEWRQVHAKALDLHHLLTPAEAAERIVEELLLSGPPEVGIGRDARETIEHVVETVPPRTHTPFQPGDVVLVSGGARGVTAECSVELAKAFRPTLVLLGRSPEPGHADDLEGLSDPIALKRELSRRNPGSPPRELADLARAVESRREIRSTLARIEAAGAKAVYRSLDVTDANAVASVVADVRKKYGPVRGLIHAAGVLADARIEDKTEAQFDAVYRTKVVGLRALLSAIGDDLKALALFSSSTARFGRAGQVDYAIANEVLNKMAHQQAARRPGCRVVSLNWGPWDGGMVTPALKELFSREGVGVIPLAAGAKLLVEELRLRPQGPCEVVVLAAGSKVEEPFTAHSAGSPALPPALPAAFERALNLDDYPVLNDHVLDGRAVLPAVLMLEWLAHAAIVQNPGLLFHGCDDLRILQGVLVEAGKTVVLKVGAAKAAKRDGFFVAPAELRSTQAGGREVLHVWAEIVLASALPAAPAAQPIPSLPAYDLTPGETYQQGLLFHGPSLHALERIEGCDAAGIVGVVRTAASPASWVKQPLRTQWLADPLAIDGSMQLAILWSQQQHGAANLPCHVQSYRQWRRSFPAEGARVVVRVLRSSERMALCDVEFLDAEGRLIARMDGYEVVIDPALARAYRRNVPALA